MRLIYKDKGAIIQERSSHFNAKTLRVKKGTKKNFLIRWGVSAFTVRLVPNPLRLCVEKIRAFGLVVKLI